MYDDLDPTSGTIENGHDPKNNIGTVLVYSFFKVHLTSGMYIYIICSLLVHSSLKETLHSKEADLECDY